VTLPDAIRPQLADLDRFRYQRQRNKDSSPLQFCFIIRDDIADIIIRKTRRGRSISRHTDAGLSIDFVQGKSYVDQFWHSCGRVCVHHLWGDYENLREGWRRS
jgi:hypothetical protein